MYYYFTFGKDPRFPVPANEYVEVTAFDSEQAKTFFRRVYGTSRDGRDNFESCYPLMKWREIEPQRYEGIQPFAKIRIDYSNEDNLIVFDRTIGGTYLSRTVASDYASASDPCINTDDLVDDYEVDLS